MIACVLLSGCSGGGGGSSSGPGTGGIEVGSLWPQADSSPPGQFEATTPPAAASVRYVFRADSGYSCCVVVDPDQIVGRPTVVLESLPVGGGSIQVSGFPTSFAPAPAGISETCSIIPDIGRSCSRNRLSAPSFDSGPQRVSVAGGVTSSVGDVQIPAVPFVIVTSLTPAINADVNNPFTTEATVADAITGVNPDSIGVALIPVGGSRRNLGIVLRACTDGTAVPCSIDGQLHVHGFIVTSADSQAVPIGTTALDITASNLAATAQTSALDYTFNVVSVEPTATPTQQTTATRGTPSIPPRASMTPTRTRTATLLPPTPTPTLRATVTPNPITLAFIHTTSFPVSPEPSYLAIGDFNRDGRDDVAVTSPEGSELHILLGNADGSFTPGTVIRFGTFPGAIAVGDLNGDAFVDLAITDERDSGVYLLYGGPNASFTTPKLRTVGRRPAGVVIGNFDQQPGNDIAITDSDANRVLFLLSDGKTPPTFRNGGYADVGAEPAEIVAADFTGDGKLDLATLNIGGAEVKDVTILGFNRVDNSGLVVFTRLTNLVVGNRPSDLHVAELNRDGRPDLVMLNRPDNDGFGEIYYLLSRPGALPTQTDPFVVHCPDRNLNCRARALTVGDFNKDNNTDVALTLNQAGQGEESDVMTVLAGSGDGSFMPGPTLPTEGQPLAMISGDITGNGFPDIIVTSAQTNAVQVYVNVSGAN